jgi:tetratricopeptide (TPR) repeat protein
MPKNLQDEFKRHNISLSQNVSISVRNKGKEWIIYQEDNDKNYILRKNEDKIGVYNNTPDSIFIDFKAPFGIVNFIDQNQTRSLGSLKIQAGRETVPASIGIEHANTDLAFLQEKVDVETFVRYSESAEDMGIRTPELDLHIKVESYWNKVLRSTISNMFGKVAPFTLIGAILGFALRTYFTHKHISPKYQDLKFFEALKRWDKVVIICKEIISIDPIYDDIQNIYRYSRKQEEEQNNRLRELYIEAKKLCEVHKWGEVEKLSAEILSERDDYKDTEHILIYAKGQLDLNKLYQEGIRAELADELQEAITIYRQVIAINPDYADTQARLSSLEISFSRRFIHDFSFMKRSLEQPKIGLYSMAHYMDSYSSEIFGRLLEITHDENVAVRHNMARAVTQMKSPIREEILDVLREDPDEGVRKIAFSLHDLIKLLSDVDKWEGAGTLLLQYGEEAVEPLISALEENFPIWPRAARLLKVLGDVAEPKLRQALNDENPLIRDRVTSILNQMLRE